MTDVAIALQHLEPRGAGRSDAAVFLQRLQHPRLLEHEYVPGPNTQPRCCNPDARGRSPTSASTSCSLAKSMRDSPRRSRDPLPRRHKQEDPAQLRGLHLCDLSPRSPITSPTMASSSCTTTGGIPTSSTARSPPTGAVFDFQVPFWHSAPEVAGCDQKDC
jgi:hypothetical protein